MTDYETSERLSAYLDGELADAERREVEELLANDATVRSLLVQLEQNQQLLRDVGRQVAAKARLSTNFTAGVLERIAQSAGASVSVEAKPASQPAAEVVQRLSELPTTRKGHRRWIYLAVANLAALVLLGVAVRMMNREASLPGGLASSDLVDQPTAGQPVDQSDDPAADSVGEPVVPPVSQQQRSARLLAAAVFSAIDKPEDVAVLRVRMPAGQAAAISVAQWLASQEVKVVDPATISPTTIAVSGAYRQNAQTAIDAGSAAKSPSEVVYLELPADVVEAALASLTDRLGDQGAVRFETELALDAKLANARLERSFAEGEGEGESVPPGTNANSPADDSAIGSAKAQRINPRILKLPEIVETPPTSELVEAPAELPPAKVKTIRILMVVE